MHAHCGRNHDIIVFVPPEPWGIGSSALPPTPLTNVHQAFTLAVVVLIILVVLFTMHHMHLMP